MNAESGRPVEDGGHIAAAAAEGAAPAAPSDPAKDQSRDTGALIDLAHQLRQSGDRAGALATFEVAAASDPGNLAIRNEIAYLLRDLDRLDEADSVFRGMLEIEPRHVGALSGIGYILRQRGNRSAALHAFEAAAVAAPDKVDLRVEIGRELQALRRFDEAEIMYRNVIGRSPAHSGALVGLGHTLRERGDRQGALAAFEAAAAGEPGNLDLRNAIAYLLRDLDRLGEAEQAFGEIVAAQPAHAGALMGLGFIRGERGDRTGSLQAFEAAAAIEPHNPAIRIQVARLLVQMDRLDEGQATYLLVLEDAPKSAAALVELAKLRKQRGDHAAAVAGFEKALAMHPHNIWVQVEFGYLLRALGRVEEAEAFFRSVLAQEPENAAAFSGLGWLMIDLHRLDAARALFSRAAAAGLGDAGPRLALGHLARRQGDRMAALIAFEAALGVEPGNIDAKLERAAELRDRGRFGEARAIIDEVLQLRPSHVAAWLHLARLDRRRGDRKGALRAIGKALEAQPLHVPALVQAAAERWSQGEPGEAARLIELALDKAPSDLEALIQHAEQAMAAEDHEAANAIARRAIAAHPRAAWPYLQAARASAELGEDAEAVQLLDRAAQMCGAQPEIAATRIQLARQSRDWAAATGVLADLADRFTGSFFLWTERMLVAIALGDHQAAEEGLLRAPVGSTLDEARVHLFRAQLRESQRRYDEAITAYREAVRLDPDDSWAHGEMARAAMILLDLDAARDHLQASLRLVSSTRILRGQSLNPSQDHLGQILDEFMLDRRMAQALREVRALPLAEQLVALGRLVRQAPEHTAPALLLAIAMRQSGLLAHSPDGVDAVAAQPIPKRIVQFWDSAELPLDVRELMRSWRKRNPGHDYHLFDDAAAKAYIDRHLPDDVARAFARARHAAQRADIFRLAYLATDGGFYVDADDRCLTPLDGFVPPATSLLLYQENYGTIGNNLVGAVPGHGLLRHALTLASQAMNRGDADTLWLSTGPALLTRAFAHLVSGLVPEAADWRPGTSILELGEAQRHVGFHCPVRYKGTERHWSRSATRKPASAVR